MKIKLTVLISLLLVMIQVVSVNAIVSDLYPDFEFDPEYDDSYSVSAYNGSSKEVSIPESLYDRAVKRFSEKAFYNNSVVESLYMHDNITVVNKWAFRNCAELRYVYFSKSLVALWDYSFAQNPELKCALIGNTEITTLYQSAFYKDTSLKYVSLPSALKAINASAFENTAIESIIIPDSVTSIKSRAFAGNESLSSIYIPDSVTSLSNDIFKNSPNVKAYVTEDSAAYKYCEKNSISYEVIEENEFPSNILGDVNNDKGLSISDVTFMQFELADIECGFVSQNCDFNGDCDFNIKDATAIQKYLA